MESCTGEHLATFTRRPGSGLYTLTTESALVAESGQVAASVEVAASYSCRLLTHQTLLWHHHLCHPSLPRLCGMHSCLLGGDCYFLLVVDEYTCYTPVFSLQSKMEVCSVLIRYIRADRRHLSARFQQDLPDVTFDRSVYFYRLHPHRSSPPVEVSSDTSGPTEGGDPTPVATVTPRRSARLVVPPRFQPRPSSPSLQPVAVNSGAARCGTTGGAGSGGAECSLGTVGTGGAGAGGTGTSRQEALSPEQLREWAVRCGSPGGGTGRAGAAVFGGACPGGASASVPRVGYAEGTGAGVTGAAGGTGGAGTAGGFGPGGASASVPVVSRAGGTCTGGTGAAGGTGGVDTGGTTGGTGVSGASRQESLSPLQICEWAVPRFASMLLAPKGDPDAPDIPTPHSYADTITGPYSSQWQAAMDAEMASWKCQTYML
ncbi:unnamed protein product [Closterium sp. NIES-53]